MFSELFTMETLDREITKARTESITAKDQEKDSDYAMNSQSSLAKFESRFAQARSWYKRQKILRTLNLFLQGSFFVPLVFWASELILSHFRELKAAPVHFEITPVKLESEWRRRSIWVKLIETHNSNSSYQACVPVTVTILSFCLSREQQV